MSNSTKVRFEPKRTSGNSWQNPKLTTDLSRSPSASLELFNNLKTAQDVANFLELPVGQLQYILYELKPKYSVFSIPKKSGGKRTLQKPCSSLMILQQKIKPFIAEIYKVKKPVHGFVSETIESKGESIKKGIKTNAEQHVKKRYVLNLDLENFFPSINFGRIRGVFKSKPFNIEEEAATVLAQICTANGTLPQGAPTSPILSNLVAASLDSSLVKLAKSYNLQYTRYADDITFSSNRVIPLQIIEKEISDEGVVKFKVGKLLEHKIIESGFTVNPAKTRLQHKSQRQEVTGLIVNSKVNLNRKFIRNTRAMIYSLDKNKEEADRVYLQKRYGKSSQTLEGKKLDGTHIKKAIYGRLDFIEMIRGSDFSPYLTFCKKMLEIDSDPPKRIAKKKEEFEMYDVFICHASEDKEKVASPIADKLESRGIKPFIDVNEILWGDSLVNKINTGLQKSKFVLAIISDSSIDKKWPMKELLSVLNTEISSGHTKILPLIVGDDEKILDKLPLLADKLFMTFDGNIDEVVDGIESRLSRLG